MQVLYVSSGTRLTKELKKKKKERCCRTKELEKKKECC
jgi:hypothetical protein